MIKQTITYMDFNNVERTEDFYFHLSTPEVIRIQAELGKDLETFTKDLARDNDMNKMIQFLEKIILTSYGVKTEDGRSFRKNAELKEQFEYSNAYAQFFEDLLITPDLALKFGRGIAEDGKGMKNRVAPKVVEQ